MTAAGIDGVMLAPGSAEGAGRPRRRRDGGEATT